MTTQEVLQQCTVDGLIVRLPDIQLDRNEYMEVKKALELIGGKWKGGKTQGFVFQEDPTELLQAQANGEGRNLKKEFQFFATPEELALEMARTLTHRVMIGDRILEPSAGHGALIKAFWNEHGHGVEVDCFEAMDLNRMKLEKLDSVNILGDDFLQCNDRVDYYDYIIANPPFTKGQDCMHIAKMYECLKPGGTIVTLSSPSWTFNSQKYYRAFREWMNELNATVKEIDEGTFKSSGTQIRTVMITIEKPKDRVIEIPDCILQKLYAVRNLGANKKAQQECDTDSGKEIYQKGIDANTELIESLEQENEQSPEEILDKIQDSMGKAQDVFNDLKNMLSPTNNTDMNFFEQLAETGNVDMTIRIMQKGARLTLNIMPGSGQSTTKPMLFSGSGRELDEEFFKSILSGVADVAGIISNIEEVKKEAEQKKESAKMASESKAKDKPAKKEKPAKSEKPTKKAEPKKPATEKLDLFAGMQEAEEQTESDNVQSTSDDQQPEAVTEDNA